MIDPSYPDVATASPDSKVETVVSKIISSISTVPGRITGAYCDDGKNQDTRTGFEGYVTPGFPINYRIHSLFLENTEEVRLKFQGSGHGNLRTCVSRDQGSIGTNCIEVKDLEEAVLKIPSPCAGYPYQCPPAYLTVTVTRTLTRCAEDDCRYPDQVRFLMRHEGLRCFRSPDFTDSSTVVASGNSNLYLYVAFQTLSLYVVSKIIGTF
ncbi:uncharacterized protein LOC110840317 [Zootermopsis nevadensis]|uniref:uncharacterized protein LOC110840317 n=1 Tax=Zootermopsis nevadensis TaxID=136037 RepID=UPI000B8E7E5B|nr:uncharacterized protein LOC110840317 [Zootermopsis nevadensis]